MNGSEFNKPALTLFLMASLQAAAGQIPQPYPERPSQPVASQSRLRFTPEEQTSIASSAAPAEISGKASLYILGPRGYEKTRTGTNGFSCLVEHQYFDTYEPICYDREGSETLLRARLLREELRAKGVPEDEVNRRIDQAYTRKKLKAPSKPGFAYMLAPDSRLYDPMTKQVIPGPRHLMFYVPYAKKEDFGGFFGLHVPFVLFEGRPDSFLIVVPASMADAEKQSQSHSPAGHQRQ